MEATPPFFFIYFSVNAMAEMIVTVSSHNFSVTNISPRARPAVETFARKYVQYGLVRSSKSTYARTALRVYAAARADRSEYRFHINQLKEFKFHLEYHRLLDEMVTYVQRPIPTPFTVEYFVKPEWTDRDYQTPVIEYLTSANPPLSKFVALQTGRGKSYCSMRAMEILKERCVIIVKPMYIEKWVLDIRRTYDIGFDDVVVVRGSDQLQALLEMGGRGELDAKIIIISNKTMQNWIKLYEQIGSATLEQGYACLPEDYCEQIGAGIRLIDEVHQDFHLNFKIDLYTNIPHSIALSATLISDDGFMNAMYEIAYPSGQR